MRIRRPRNKRLHLKTSMHRLQRTTRTRRQNCKHVIEKTRKIKAAEKKITENKCKKVIREIREKHHEEKNKSTAITITKQGKTKL